MDKTNLPPLPEPAGIIVERGSALRGFTADQMHEYAARAVREAVPDGMVLVPRELTDAMFVAYLAHMSVGKKPPDPDRWLALAQSAWDAMLAAAPPPPLRDASKSQAKRIAALTAEPLRDAGAVVEAAWTVVNAYGGDDEGPDPAPIAALRYELDSYERAHPAPAQVDEAAVERAARALYASQGYPLGWDEAEQGYRDVAYDLARTALTAAAKEGKWADDGFYTYGPDGQRYALRGPD